MSGVLSREGRTEITVRDYECDSAGIVNNAIYLNYLEHARHELLRKFGVVSVELHERGIDPVVSRIEIDYLIPLRPRDRVSVVTRLSRKGHLRLVFGQEIVLVGDNAISARATVQLAFVSQGRPVPPPTELQLHFSSLTE